MCKTAFESKGVECIVFRNPDHVPDEGNYVYMTQHHHVNFRATDKAVAMALSAKRNIKLFGSRLEQFLYDDKVAQYRVFDGSMPRSYELTTPLDAHVAIDKLSLPFISKSALGAAASNVDFITTREQAEVQISQAFSAGIIRHYGLRQKDYLFWQEFLPGNDYQYKVILLANKYALLMKKDNRADVPLASGSPTGSIVAELDDENYGVLLFASAVANHYKLSFVGMDIIFDYSCTPKQHRLLEITTDWATVGQDTGSRVFERIGSDNAWRRTDIIQHERQDMFDLLPAAFSEWDFQDDFVWPDTGGSL